MSDTREFTDLTAVCDFQRSNDEVVEITTRASAVAAAERACGAAGPTASVDPRPPYSRALREHEQEMQHLLLLQWGTRAPVLERLIGEARQIKQETFGLAQAHTAASDVEFILRREGGGDEEIAAAEASEQMAEATWQEARGRLEEKALEILDAPFDDLGDVLTRTDAFALLVGSANQKTDDGGLEPALDEDIACAYRGLRRAISEVIAAHPANEAFGEAEIAYRKADQVMSDLGAELMDNDARVAKGVVFDPGLQDELCTKQQKAFEAREAAADAILAQRPATLSDLILQMQIVAKELSAFDLGTHAARGRMLGSVTPTVVEMRSGDPGHEARALGLLLENATRLAQQDLASGWRALLADEGGIVKLHPNARDVVALAASKHLDPSRFSGIHLAGQSDDKLPQITFGTDHGHAIAMPGVVYDWKPVQ